MPVKSDPNRDKYFPTDTSRSELNGLRLLHLADSALPIGALAHSFGLESLVSSDVLRAGDLSLFLQGYLEETGMMEAVFCRGAFRLSPADLENFSSREWIRINDRFSALRTARESRAASASLGLNFLNAILSLGNFPILRDALDASKRSASLIHHSAAFGLVSGVLGFEENPTVLAYLHQIVAALISACQRLLPLGQSEATRILWNSKPAIIAASGRSAACKFEDACCFMPLLDWGAVEHPALTTRLFIS
jgi:urease accessory protein